jgi:superfamily II DNA or RNA helicase
MPLDLSRLIAEHAPPDSPPLIAGAANRLRHACENGAGTADIACLLSDLLRRSAARQTQDDLTPLPPIRVEVPTGGGAPTSAEYEKAGLHVCRTNLERVVLEARSWQPAWLEGADVRAPAAAAVRGDRRRRFEPVLGDPCLVTKSQFASAPTYRCVGQRDAVRSAVLLPAGETLCVNLPTGAGKSRCAQIPALLDSDGLTVVVVPTSALCIDQEIALQEVAPNLPQPTAYFGSDRERKSVILARLQKGEQRVVISSPEALLQSLRPYLYAAARRGALRRIVIDEAHIVGSWGESFRPHFQLLAGLRRGLLEACPSDARFATILLSGTLTAANLRLLERLFAVPKPLRVVHAVQLRPEPSYWVSKCAAEEKDARVLEAVWNLPRPFLLYATTRDDAQKWSTRLRDDHFHRLAMVTGGSSDAEREEAIRGLADQSLDIVVATSAFGLGIDQDDIRAVLHACVPESLDRFYQEVGRGGRDGCAALSLIVHSSADVAVARSLIGQHRIGVPKALERWRRMIQDAERLERDLWLVRPNDPWQPNQRNLQWDDRTLVLMDCAGLIELDDLPPAPVSTEVVSSASDEAERWGSTRPERYLRLLEPKHRELDVWQRRFDPVRHRAQADADRAMDLMERVLSREECVGLTLANMYAAEGAFVAQTCGGCPVCRSSGFGTSAEEMSSSGPVVLAPATVERRIAAVLGPERTLGVHYDIAAWRGIATEIAPFLDTLVRGGFRATLAERGVLEAWWKASSLQRHHAVLWISDEHEAAVLGLPWIWILSPGQPVPVDWKRLARPDADRPPFLFIFPESAREPSRGGERLLHEIWPASLRGLAPLRRDLGA